MRRGEHEAAAPAGKGGATRVLPAEPTAHADRGRSLDTATAGRMGAALGHSFADVRIHDDPAAGEQVRAERAIATTVGTDIAFAPGAYQPGTLHGDALLAHELAHVQQQRGALNENVAPAGGNSRALEEDAEQATVGALARMHGMGDPAGARGATRTGPRTLQRCGGAPSWAPRMPAGTEMPGASASATLLTPPQVDALLSASPTVGPYIQPKMNPTGACAGSPKTVTGSTRYHEPGEYRDAQENYTSRRLHPQHTTGCNSRTYTQAEGQAEPSWSGFADDGLLHVNTAGASDGTPLHEGLHFFQSDSIFGRCGAGGREGMTEFLTRTVLREGMPALLGSRNGHYDAEHDAVKAMSDAPGVGPALICDAYFNGNWGPLERAVNAGNPGRFSRWCDLMKQVPADPVAAAALF